MLIQLIIIFSNNYSIIGLIPSIIVDIAFGLFTYLGGFYFLIIPLPFVAFWKVGCAKTNIHIGIRILLGILCFVCCALAFILPAIF